MMDRDVCGVVFPGALGSLVDEIPMAIIEPFHSAIKCAMMTFFF